MKRSNTHTHGHFMALALDLAEKGRGYTSPNPMVGAVLVKGDRVIARGYHHRYGGDHAEVDCLKKVQFKAPKGSTLYVTLEPCCHQGLTPPCTDAVIRSGVSRVVIASTDPNPKVAGKGIRLLKRAGIDVVSGVLAAESEALNDAYYRWRKNGRPHVILKAAMSVDGKIGLKTGESKWITGIEARSEAHRLRSEVDAILVGVQTVIADDPELTVRHVPLKRKAPLKVVLDPRLRIPLRAALFREGEVLIVCGREAASGPKAKALRARGIEICSMTPNARGELPLKKILNHLGKKQILSLLVEGGASTYSRLMRDGLVDEMALFVAPRVIGKDGLDLLSGWGVRRLTEGPAFSVVDIQRFGKDWLVCLKKGNA